MKASHEYRTALRWTGNTGAGTSAYDAYGRDHVIEAPGKALIRCSADAAFRGDGALWNPEEMLIASIAACHMLWFLHLAADSGLVVESYEDRASGEMRMNRDGSGEFVSATLRPHVTISAGDPSKIGKLHEEAHGKCFIARSLNFPVACEGTVEAS